MEKFRILNHITNEIIMARLIRLDKHAVMQVEYGFCDSPYGELLAAAYGPHLCFLTFVQDRSRDFVLESLQRTWPGAVLLRDDNALQPLVGMAFEGTADAVYVAGTDMQYCVWQAIARIPRGQTIPYSQLAVEAGYPRAVRAVASAVGANPVPVAIPCHRVVRRSGEIGKFAFGTLMKIAMLRAENAPIVALQEFELR